MKREDFVSVGCASGDDKTSSRYSLKAFYPDIFFAMFSFFSVLKMVRCSFIRSFVWYDDEYLLRRSVFKRCTPHSISVSSSSKRREKKRRADKIQTSIYLVFNAPYHNTNIQHTPHILSFFLRFITWQWLWWYMLWVLAATVTTAVAGRHEGTRDVVYFSRKIIFIHMRQSTEHWKPTPSD